MFTLVLLRFQFLALFFSPCILSLCPPLLTHTLSCVIHLLMTYNCRCLLPRMEYLSYFTLCSHSLIHFSDAGTYSCKRRRCHVCRFAANCSAMHIECSEGGEGARCGACPGSEGQFGREAGQKKCVIFMCYSSEKLITLNTLHEVVPTWYSFHS